MEHSETLEALQRLSPNLTQLYALAQDYHIPTLLDHPTLWIKVASAFRELLPLDSNGKTLASLTLFLNRWISHAKDVPVIMLTH